MTTTSKPLCYNRPPAADTRRVQDGWTLVEFEGALTQIPVMLTIPDNMSKGCQQWGPLGEARLKGWDCDGCRWKTEGIEKCT